MSSWATRSLARLSTVVAGLPDTLYAIEPLNACHEL